MEGSEGLNLLPAWAQAVVTVVVIIFATLSGIVGFLRRSSFRSESTSDHLPSIERNTDKTATALDKIIGILDRLASSNEAILKQVNDDATLANISRHVDTELRRRLGHAHSTETHASETYAHGTSSED